MFFPPSLAHYERKFKQWQSHFQGAGATGMLLVYPNHYVHLVELGIVSFALWKRNVTINVSILSHPTCSCHKILQDTGETKTLFLSVPNGFCYKIPQDYKTLLLSAHSLAQLAFATKFHGTIKPYYYLRTLLPNWLLPQNSTGL